MGFDITFHPISSEQLCHYFFDVLADPKLAGERIGEITKHPKHQTALRRLYAAFPKMLALKQPVGSSFAFTAAVLAGFLHPYWYARGQGFSLLPRAEFPGIDGLFTPLGQVQASILSDLEDNSKGFIVGNESASGFLLPEKIAPAQALLEQIVQQRDAGGGPQMYFDEDGLASLRAALNYCRQHQLGMIEASDVVVPFAGDSFTPSENMRAPFLGKMAP